MGVTYTRLFLHSPVWMWWGIFTHKGADGFWMYFKVPYKRQTADVTVTHTHYTCIIKTFAHEGYVHTQVKKTTRFSKMMDVYCERVHVLSTHVCTPPHALCVLSLFDRLALAEREREMKQHADGRWL